MQPYNQRPFSHMQAATDLLLLSGGGPLRRKILGGTADHTGSHRQLHLSGFLVDGLGVPSRLSGEREGYFSTWIVTCARF